MDGGCLTWRKKSAVRGSALTGLFAWREKVDTVISQISMTDLSGFSAGLFSTAFHKHVRFFVCKT